MNRTFFLALMALCLATALPTVAEAGNGGVGACIAVFGDLGPNVVPPGGFEEGIVPGFAVCIDAVEEDQCFAFCGFEPGDSDGKILECIWDENLTCAEAGAKIPWDGACDAIDSPFGPICGLLFTPPPGSSQEICEDAGFVWLGDGSVCGGVPALPKVAYGVLALVLLAGTMTILTLQSRSS